MFILGDDSKHNGKIPWVTFSLIVINVLVFVAQCFLGERFTNGFSLVPVEITEFRDLTRPEPVKFKYASGLEYNRYKKKVETRYSHQTVTVNHYHGPFPIILTLITSMFLHGDWLHLIGNMWFLAVFGRNVECAFDHGRFLAFYIACGVAGGLAHVFSGMDSVIPCLGASGAISGVMGAYVSIHPLNTVRIWLGLGVGVIELPALVVVGVWFLFQYFAAFMELDSGVSDGTAYWDHIGGFGAGVAILWGTVFYLKTQPPEPIPDSEADEEQAAAPAPLVSSAVPDAPVVKSPDPFATFLGNPKSRVPESDHDLQPALPKSRDPFANFLDDTDDNSFDE